MKAIKVLKERISKDFKNARLWIPALGWGLFFGVFNNCVIAPYLHITPIEWGHLILGLSVMLGVSGARDIGLERSKDYNGARFMYAEENGHGSKKPNLRLWIRGVGAALALGVINDLGVVPYLLKYTNLEIERVSMPNLITVLGIMLAVSGGREVLLRVVGKKFESPNCDANCPPDCTEHKEETEAK